MTPVAAKQGSPWIVPVKFPDSAITWAGPGSRDQEFCFGSEDGRLCFTTVNGHSIGELESGEASAEAVNGVAFIGPMIAVSTRAELTFLTLPRPGEKAKRGVFSCGAHGVIATAEGYFVAPLGRTGLMKLRAGRRETLPIMVSRERGRTIDFYKTIALYSYGRPEVLASAARFGGVVATELLQEGDTVEFSSITSPGLDVVDVCSLGTGVLPPAIAALGKDGTLLLMKNVLHDKAALTLRFDDISGVAYRILCSHGSIFILTSTGLFTLRGLAERFLASEPVDQSTTPMRLLPLEAVDAGLCGDRWLLIVLPEEVLRIDVECLLEDPHGPDDMQEQRSITPTLIHPTWELHKEAIEQVSVA